MIDFLRLCLHPSKMMSGAKTVGAAIFNAEISFDGTANTISMSGPIDEKAQFPQVKSEGTIKIDLSGVTRMSSVGVRKWCVWMSKFKLPAQMFLTNCPVIIVKNLTLVRGFLSPCCKIYSFAIPFYSEDTGERKDVMAVFGEHFTAEGFQKIPQVFDSKGGKMVMDVIPDSYFAFLLG